MSLGTSQRLHQLLLPMLALVLVVVTLAPRQAPPTSQLYAEGVRVGEQGRPVSIPRGADPSAAGPTWRGAVPGEGTRWEPMARRAMADLDVLTLDTGSDTAAVLAGWHRSWRYVWPRDASFAAAALAVSGRHDDALAALAFLQQVQEDDGTWHARYTADGAVPDERGVQLDAVGWSLWATWVWAQSARAQGVPDGDVAAGLERLRPMLVGAATAATWSVDPHRALPHASPDYWEVPVRETSLGTAAPVLVGLRAAVALLPELGEAQAARHAAEAERRLTDGVIAQFGRRGYPRLVTTRQPDASVAFLMPPFTIAPAGQRNAFSRASHRLRTPDGGLRPGAEFKDPDVSWTPQTALFAMTSAASGSPATAGEYLDWLERHRTRVGSLPEKVDAAGEPVSVAPLAWTAALVLLTLAALDGDLPAPPPVPRR